MSSRRVKGLGIIIFTVVIIIAVCMHHRKIKNKTVKTNHPVVLKNLPPSASLQNAAWVTLQSVALMGDKGHTQLVLRLDSHPIYTIKTDKTHQVVTLILDNIKPTFSVPPLDTQDTVINHLNFNITPDSQLLISITVLPDTDIQRLRFEGNNLVLDMGLMKQIPYINNNSNSNNSNNNPAIKISPLVKIPVPLSKEQIADQNYNEALDLINQGNTDGAAGLLTALIKKNPTYNNARVMLASLLLQQNKAAESLAVLQAVNEKLPLVQNVNYYDVLAETYRQLGEFKKALMVYQQLLNYNPDNAPWWVGLGMCFEALNQNAAATEAYQHAEKSQNITPALDAFLIQKQSDKK